MSAAPVLFVAAILLLTIFYGGMAVRHYLAAVSAKQDAHIRNTLADIDIERWNEELDHA